MFQKILIANRGEIAVRIIRTARKLGIRTVAVYAADDAPSVHVSLADEAFLLQGTSLKETYLNQELLIRWHGNPGHRLSIRDMAFYRKMLRLLKKRKKPALFSSGQPRIRSV